MNGGCLWVTKFLLCIFKTLSLNHKTRKMGFLIIDKQQFSNLRDNHQNISLYKVILLWVFKLYLWVLKWGGMSTQGSGASGCAAHKQMVYVSSWSSVRLVGASTPQRHQGSTSVFLGEPRVQWSVLPAHPCSRSAFIYRECLCKIGFWKRFHGHEVWTPYLNWIFSCFLISQWILHRSSFTYNGVMFW